MTPVQEQAIPFILEGKDCLAEAPTGTGKTFAFGLPAIEKTDVNSYSVQTIILCPTRELAMQIESELLKLTVYTEGIRILAIYGGQPIEKQLYKLRKKPQIIVGTPGRVMDHIRRKTLRLENVKTVVLDEADEMLNMGFRADIDTILSSMPKDVGMQLFSATIPKEILEISKEYQHEPVRIKAPCKTSDLPNIEQYFIKVTEDGKFDALKAVMSQKDYRYVLVFCNTKRRVSSLDEKLNNEGYLSMALHGDLQQRQRDTVMRNYRDRKINILVATDVAARGIDVADIEAVINYDLPNNEDYYVHRIGRTARASKTGEAFTFTTTKDQGQIKYLEKHAGAKMEEITLKDNKITKKEPEEKNTSRFFINIGQKDGATNKLLTAYLEENAGITPDCVADIKILELFSFIELTLEAAESIFRINGKKFGGRKISVEAASPSNKSKGDYSKKSSGSSDKKYSQKPSGNGERKPYAIKGDGERKPYPKKADGESKPYARKSEGYEGKPYARKTDGESKPYSRKGEGYEGKPYARKTDGDSKPYARKSESSSYAGKKSYSTPKRQSNGASKGNNFTPKKPRGEN